MIWVVLIALGVLMVIAIAAYTIYDSIRPDPPTI